MRHVFPVLFVSLIAMVGCSQNQKASQDPGVDESAVERYLQTQNRTTTVSTDGVQTLPSGLKFEVLTEGSGRSPGYNDTVLVHYRGWNEQNQLFDDSYQRGGPVALEVDGVIEGWTQALRLMREGSKWRIVVPPYLAYGQKGNGRTIGPNETLTFEIELLKVH